MDNLIETLSKIPDKISVRAGIPVRDTPEKIRLHCIYLAEDPPNFSLFFPPEALPLERLDQQRKCVIMIDFSGKSASLAADILTVHDAQTLRMIAKEVINHTQLREYFRVDVSTPIMASSIIPREFEPEEAAWKLSGKTIDVSGSGILAAFSEPLEINKKVRIEILLPTAEEHVIKAVAHVIRTKKIRENKYHIAFHFDKIASADRDRIIACCFEIQRKHLKLKVQIKGNQL